MATVSAVKACDVTQSLSILRIFLRRGLLLAIVVLCFNASFSQTSNLGASQANPMQGAQPDCTDPMLANSPFCINLQSQPGGGNPAVPQTNASSPTRTPSLFSPYYNQDQFAPATPPPNPSEIAHRQMPTRPETEFEQMVADSVGRPLPLFGESFFIQPPSTFSPIDWMQVPSDYVIGPGDELQVRIWGQVEANLRAIVDRSGQIYIPKVGQVVVAGVHYDQLENYLKQQVSKVFKNFNLTANIGRLRSIQVYVVGDARYPGTYTISSLSTLVNAIFASGGPTTEGSLRHIQVRRDGATITDFDFYDLLIKGDKSKDVRLQSGDVIYIPHVGPLVAISGSVNVPAIYEMKENSTLGDLIEIAGNLSTVADTGKITIDRFIEHQARTTLEFPFDDKSRAERLQDGDIVHVFSIVPKFVDTVTLRGQVANPGRYPWKPGMRVRDLIPDAQALLTRDYWRERADIVNGRATEYPIEPEQPNQQPLNPQGQNGANASGNAMPSPSTSAPAGATPQPETGNAGVAAAGAANQQIPANAPSSASQAAAAGTSATEQSSLPEYNPNGTRARNVADDVRRYAPEINWDYAIIQRVNPQDLSSKLIWLSPRKAIIEKDEQANLELEPGDIVTIFSQKDISVPTADRSQYVIVEGEVKRPGVYKLALNETMRSVLERAGGLTPDAYVYGTQFTRESARIAQQRSLDELAHTMEVQVRQSAMSVAASSNPGDLSQLMAAQQAIIDQLRATRASGRVALSVRPRDNNVQSFPDLVMEDGDRVVIPHTPSTVSVVGDVYNPGSFIFESRNTAGMYLQIAGKGKPQSDLHHAFVLRANGVVVAANNVNGIFTGSKFERLHLFPGDQIVVPYKLPTGVFVRSLQNWTQISSQLALTAAALAVLAP
jgi:protein involved in polysaccharide export with SLBB domain